MIIDGAVRGVLASRQSRSRARLDVSDEAQLREKLRKIEALFAGAGTTGERIAAEAVLGRLRARLAELERRDAPIEVQFSLPDQWSRRLFVALSRRYGLKPYRLYRQRLTTVMLRVPKGFLDQVLWPEELNTALAQYLNEVTIRVIREEVHRDTSEAAEVPQALQRGRILSQDSRIRRQCFRNCGASTLSGSGSPGTDSD
jgi:hypothetical protein